MGVRDITKIHSFYILFITFSIISIFVSNFQAYAVEEIWTDYGTMKELVKDIRNGNKDDDKVNYDKFKDSSVYKNANEDLRKCIDLADKVGEKLGDYEIVRCFENTNYFKEKYVDDNNENVSQQEQQNETNQNQSTRGSSATKRIAVTENNSEQQEQQNETNQNQSNSEEAVQQKELQLTENNSEQQEQQNETNQNQSSSEEAVQQKELQLTENNSEQQEQQNMMNQNQSQIQNQTNDERKSQTTESDVGSNDGCDPSYPDICITTYSEK